MSINSEPKLFNIYFFGDEKIFVNKEQKDLKKEIEIHGEKINLNLLEHPDISIVSNEEKKLNGILLFYNVNDTNSFNKLKETIEKLIDMNKYEMPLIVVGNNYNNQERKITYDEAKNFLDKYGIKYHEINSGENVDINFQNIFNDLGEQVLYQEIIAKNNEANLDNNNSNEKEIIKESNENTNKLEESKENNEDKNKEEKGQNEEKEIKEEKENEKEKNKILKKNKEKRASFINKPFKPKIKSETNDVKEKKTSAQIKREELVREKRLKREKEMQQWYKKKEYEGIEQKKKKEKENKLKFFEKLKEDKENQKKKEKEVKEEYSNQKKERYEKSKKIREEEEKKFNSEKEKNKTQLEQKLKSEKANIKKLLNQNEELEKKSIEQKRAKIFSPNSSFRKKRKNTEFDLNNVSAILNNTISEFNISEESTKTKKIKNIKKLNTNTFQTLKKHSTTINIFDKKNSKSNKLKKNNTLKEKDKTKQENKDIITKKDESEKEEKQKEKDIKENLQQNYLDNAKDIYRCIYCSRIPIININEHEHNISINCSCEKNNNYSSICNYSYFIKKSLDHPMTNDNITCDFCLKKLNELKEQNNITEINFCDLCNKFICTEDDLNHKNYHDIINHKELKEQYKKIFLNKTVVNKSKTLKRRKTAMDNKNSKLINSTKDLKTKKRTTVTPKQNRKDDDKKKLKLNKTEIKKDNDIDKINEDKIPVFMKDSCCIEHNKIYKYYCFTCNKNICSICKEKHSEHNLINLNEIEINEKDLSNIKQLFEKELSNLKKINDYFYALIEKIKQEFADLYELKMREIEIKQKIIENYEIVKYNYNSIKNVQNILNQNKNSFSFNYDFNENNKKDTLKEINTIFNLVKNNKGINHKKEILLQSNDILDISSIIKLDTNDIAISSYGGNISIYNNQNYELILTKKIFEENEGINCMIQLRNGDLALVGKKIKIINLNLQNKICDILHEIKLKDGLFESILEIGNNLLITYDTNNELKLWKNYKFISKYNATISDLYKIDDNSFISSSINENKINLYKLSSNKSMPELIEFPLNEKMNIKKGKNSLIKLNNSYFVFIYEKFIEQNREEKFEESKNNEEEKEQGICLIEINSRKNDFKILDKVENFDKNTNYINLVNYLNEQFIVIEDYSKNIEICGFNFVNKKLYMKNKINVFSNDEIIINTIYIEETNDFIYQTNKNLVCLSNY